MMSEETYESESYGFGGYESFRTEYIISEDMDSEMQAAQRTVDEMQETVSSLIENVNHELSLLSNLLTWRGTVDTVGMLPDDADVGDVYHVAIDGSEWAWDGEQWQELGTVLSLDGYYDADEVDGLLAEKADADHTHSASDIANGTLSIDRIPNITPGKTQSDGFYYRVQNYGDLTSLGGHQVRFPCLYFVVSTKMIYDVDEDGL